MEMARRLINPAADERSFKYNGQCYWGSVLVVFVVKFSVYLK